VGKFLRKTKINELPQLLNIFFGDMSVIGPRPLTQETFSVYPKEAQRIIIKIRPGLSGIGSIIFHREEEILADEAGSMNFYKTILGPYKSSVEVWYVNNQSLRIYMLAMLITVMTLLLPNSGLVWRMFPNLPIPPECLRNALGYPASPTCL
jgi:lipopolysaccharide/colanic/teichoic acid biosynthesis glycosyltransferase